MAHPRPLHGVHVAILVEHAFEQVELSRPRDALHAAGATTALISPRTPVVRGWNGEERDEALKVDFTIAEAKPLDFDALFLPGGLWNADALRTNNKAVLFVHALQIARKPIAAIGHAPWVLIETDFVRGRKLTSWPSLRTDVVNAGGTWINQAVVRDDLLVTSRKAADVAQFSDAMIALFTPQEQSIAAAS